jgi:hypothetical protein
MWGVLSLKIEVTKLNQIPSHSISGRRDSNPSVCYLSCEKRACEIDSIVLQHQKLSINNVEKKSPQTSRNPSPRFFSREPSPKPNLPQSQTPLRQRFVRFSENNQSRPPAFDKPIKCYACNRLGHIARNCFSNSYRSNFRGTNTSLFRRTSNNGYGMRGNRGNTSLTRGRYQNANQNFQCNTSQYRKRTNYPRSN